MRRTYESEADRKRQMDMAQWLTDTTGRQYEENKRHCELDWTIRGVHKEVVGFAEFKFRNYSSTQIQAWGGLMISLCKFGEARLWHAVTGLPLEVVLRATDGVYMGTYRTGADFLIPRVEWTGRTDRGDKDDVEACVILDLGRFTRIDLAKP